MALAHPIASNGKETNVTLTDSTYLFPTALVLLMVLALIRYFAVLRTGRQTNFQGCKAEAERLGSVARKDAEGKTKALFDEFRCREKSL